MATFGNQSVSAALTAARPVFGKRPAGAPLIVAKAAKFKKPAPELKAVFPQAARPVEDKPVSAPKASPPSKVATPKPSRPKAQVHTDAGFGQPVWARRVGARLVDELGLWLLIYVVFHDSLMASLKTYASVQPGRGTASSTMVELFGLGLIFVIAQSVYNIAMEASSHQATLGKILAGVVVTDRYGGSPRLRSVITRNTVGRPAVNMVPFFSGYLTGMFNKERRCVHDVMAGTVVRRRVPRDMTTDYSEVFA